MMPHRILAPGDRTVSWLGQCPSDWRFKPLKYLCAVNKRVLPETTDPDSEFRYIDISSVDSDGRWMASELMNFAEAPSRARRVLVDGDVLVSTVRTYLRAITHVEKFHESLICSTGFAVLSANGLVDPRFLAYWVRSHYFIDEVVARSEGVSYPAINASDIGNLPFPIIQTDHQRTIAAFLDRETERIDALIEKKQRQIQLLQEKRSALISYAVTKGLDPNVKMKDSGIEWLGEIPEHWKIASLRSVLRQRGEYNDGPRTTNILSVVKDVGVINYNEREASGNKKSDNIEQYKIIHEGDIVLNRMNVIIGSVGIAKEFGAASIEYYVLYAKDESAYTNYYGYIFSSRLFQTNLGRLGSGILGHRLRIPFEILKKEILPQPPISEQRAIAFSLDRQTARIDIFTEKVHESIEKLREYRTALISAAVTGKIDVCREAA